MTGGPGRPEHLNRGYFVRPTVFADVTPQMTIANTEIFGPVMTMVGYESEEDAIRIANDTEYGLAAYLQTSDPAAPAASPGCCGRAGGNQLRPLRLFRPVRRLQTVGQWQGIWRVRTA